MSASKKKTIEYYRSLPYNIRLEPAMDSDGAQYWLAEIPELRGCKTEGETRAQAVANLHELFDEYIEARLESDFDIPEPTRIPGPKMEPPYLVVPFSRTKDRRTKKG